MNKKFYSLLDSKIGAFLNPFTATNDGEAIRLFTTWVNDTTNESNISKYPADYSLFFIGEFDDSTGNFKQDAKREIVIGVSVLQEQQRTFTVKELIMMLEDYYQNQNVVNLNEEVK